MGGTFSAAVLGGLVAAGVVKFVGEHWIPAWLTARRAQQLELQRQLAGVRAPAVRALAELHDRLAAIASTGAHGHHYARTIDEPDYFVDSTAYLVARVFAWQEILRQQMAQHDHPRVYLVFESLTKAFANGHPGFQFLRFEQTELGERLTPPATDGPGCLSYADFLDWCRRDDAPACLGTLRRRVRTLLDDPAAEHDRLRRIDRCLLGAVEVLDRRRRWRSLLTAAPIGAQPSAPGGPAVPHPGSPRPRQR
ncbi:hypothetical protein [Micromonospora sp. NPDC050495]|uniref:hypothetical protein n=1 Tax=Micromonospora sp. NPDC050495 TaxID=3154936 RepID=UPI0033C694B4